MKILLLEDERDIAEPVVSLLRAQRYDVTWVDSCEAAYQALGERDYDLAVLDIMLPEGEDAGFEFAVGLRSAGFGGGILFLTARDSVEDRIRGLDLGGDDYLIKPFSLKELLARVRSLLRRGAQTRTASFRRGPLEVEFAARRVRWDGREVKLTEREFAMLELFALYPDKVFTVDDLLDRFFPDAASGHRIIRVYVNQLRQKIAEEVLETVPNGYMLSLGGEPAAPPQPPEGLRTNVR